jgi:hypothetical protein
MDEPQTVDQNGTHPGREFSQGCAMKTVRNYERRAAECRAFAKNARDEEERHQLLAMANTLESLALKSGPTAENARFSTARTRFYHM